MRARHVTGSQRDRIRAAAANVAAAITTGKPYDPVVKALEEFADEILAIAEDNEPGPAPQPMPIPRGRMR